MVRLVAAQEAALPTIDQVKQLQAKYRAERERVVQSGAVKRFVPILFEKAEEFAKRGDAALAAGRLLQAAEAFRQARWQLPYESPQVPNAHVALVIGNLRLRHGNEVKAISFSPDGQRLASGGYDRLVKIWDLGNGHELLTYAGHSDFVYAVEFSPDGRWLASGAAERDIHLWDTATGKLERTLQGLGTYTKALAWSPNGKYLAVGQGGPPGTPSGHLLIFDAATGELKRSITDFRQMVNSVAFSGDGAILAAGTGDGTLRLWEFPKVIENPTQPEYWAHHDPSGAVYQVAFSPDQRSLVRVAADGVKIYQVSSPGQPFAVAAPRRIIPGPAPGVRFSCVQFSKDGKTLFLGAADGVVRLFDPETGQMVGTLKGHQGDVRALALNRSGSQLASAGADYTIRLWDFDAVMQSRSFVGHDAPVWSSALSPDGQQLATASADRTVKLWDVASGKVRHRLTGHAAPVTVVQFAPDGGWLASGGGDAVVKLWDARSGELRRDLEGHKGPVTTLDIAGDSSKLVSGSVDKTVRIWDAATGALQRTIELDAIVAAVAFSPDGLKVAVGAIDQSVRIYDLLGNLQQRWTAHGTAVSGLAFSPDGQWLASCGADQIVRVWNLTTPGTNPITLSGHVGPLTCVAFRRDSQHLASCGSDQVVRLWRIENGMGKEVQAYRGHRDWVTSVAFSKDGFYLVSSGVDKTARLWEITTRDIPLLPEHGGAVETVAVSPDGSKIASGASDRSIRLWDRTTGHELTRLTGHSDAITYLAFTPDGKTLISSSVDRSIRLWDVTTGRELPRSPAQQQSFTGLRNYAPYLVVAPDGKKLIVWLPGNDRFATVGVFDVDTGAELFSFTDQGRQVHAMSFSANGKYAATAARNGAVRLWDLDRRGQALPGGDWFFFDKGVNLGDIALTPDGATLVVTSEAGDVKIADVAKREVLHQFKAGQSRIPVCLVSPDGKRFVTAAEDNVVKLWDLATGRELRSWDMKTPPQRRGSFVRSVAFSPDGRHLVTGNANTTVFVLELP
ncbi:MAG: hypothetical protein NZO58_02845 [Gemmataceae bacterium]|nr:hypothetical protein [Gemmataceae bacterium]